MQEIQADFLEDAEGGVADRLALLGAQHLERPVGRDGNAPRHLPEAARPPRVAGTRPCSRSLARPAAPAVACHVISHAASSTAVSPSLAAKLYIQAEAVSCIYDSGLSLRLKHALGLRRLRSEEHTSELQSLMRISYAVFCLKKKNYN